MADTSFDLIVIGGGPGGYVAAIRAAQLGMKAALVEANHLGGVCLNWGCIPTKALLRSAEVYNLIKHSEEFGIKTKGLQFDLEKMVERSREVAGQLNGGVGQLLKMNKVKVFDGRGHLAGAGSVIVEKDGRETHRLSAKRIILATGARPRLVEGLEPDGKLVWTYKEALVPDVMPQSLLVVGSGAIGMEFASFYATLGAAVTVVEMLDRVLPAEDEEISALAQKAFAAQGMRIFTSAAVKGLNKGKSAITATIEAEGKSFDVEAERAIVAAGIVANTENLGLEGTRVRVEGSHVLTDPWGWTGEEGVFAIGDLSGPPWLAHKASHEALAVVDGIAGVEGARPLDASRIPGCTYCRPQVASIGLTERQAADQGHEVKIGRSPYKANGKALALGEPEGLVKTVFDADSGELLGAHMIGGEVTELIGGFAVAINLETTEAELMETVFPHPTLSETMHESVLDAFGRAIHF